MVMAGQMFPQRRRWARIPESESTTTRSQPQCNLKLLEICLKHDTRVDYLRQIQRLSPVLGQDTMAPTARPAGQHRGSVGCLAAQRIRTALLGSATTIDKTRRERKRGFEGSGT